MVTLPALTLHVGSALLCSRPLYLPACKSSLLNRLSLACRHQSRCICGSWRSGSHMSAMPNSAGKAIDYSYL